ncbi:cell division ATP-binding protein FtsE [Candidatus Poribacteria bacterium]|nr:cell division ATP-binding protein FtsE [Candidatus Poribacteria bacterium]
MIQMFGVSMQYKRDVEVLHNINMDVEKGEFVFLVGPSGAGKSTVLKLLYRGLVPSSGSIVVAGYNLSKIRNSKLPHFRRRLGVVFQDFKLLPHKTVEQNVAFSMRVTGARRSQIKKNVERCLNWTGLKHRKNALPEDISGGEQQRTSIARAIVNDPTLILADEPTGNLDPRLSLEIMHLFERLNTRGTTVLVATHDINLVEQMEKRVIRIEKGKILEE